MSRIGRMPIAIPSGVEVKVDGQVVDTYDTVTAMLQFENGCTWTVENSWIVPNGFAKADDSCTHIMCENTLIRVDSQRRGVEFFDAQKGYTPNIAFMQNNGGRLVGFGIDGLEHCSLLDEETAQIVEEAGAYIVPTFCPYEEAVHYDPVKIQTKQPEF